MCLVVWTSGSEAGGGLEMQGGVGSESEVEVCVFSKSGFVLTMPSFSPQDEKLMQLICCNRHFFQH